MGKGVITAILESHEMPVNQDGVRADIISDPMANVNRMKYAGLYEQYLNQLKARLQRDFYSRLGINDPSLAYQALGTNPAVFEYVDKTMDRYYELVSVKHSQFYRGLSKDEKVKYLANGIQNRFIDYIPPENDIYLPEMIQKLEDEFHVPFGKVNFKTKEGMDVTSSSNIRIGEVYMILLEKIAAEWSSVALSKTQQNGIITYVSGKDKHATPTKRQATRVLGESEQRIMAAYVGGDFAVELHDRSNNPNSRKKIADTILSAHEPMKIERIIDRNEYPLGYSQPLQMVNHIVNCLGYEFKYKPYDPNLQTKKPVEENE